jgi:hypothetical protein
MKQILIVGLGTGVASALLLAAPIASGSVLALLLLYLSPLPIMLAGLGWSHWAGLIAALVAAAILGALFGVVSFPSFLLGMTMPAWWLGYLALLARPSRERSELEWYPTGRIVLWAALLSAAIVTIAVLLVAPDQATIRPVLRKTLDEMASGQVGGAAGIVLSPDERSRLLDLFMVLLPPAMAASLVIVNLLNLWLAGRIVLLSARLARPWPAISVISLPRIAPMLLALAVAGTFAPDLIGAPALVGTISASLAAPLLVAHLMVGFAVIHAVTVGANTRAVILAGVYAAFLILSPHTSLAPIAIAAVGLAETLFGIRCRVAAKRVPPRQGT